MQLAEVVALITQRNKIPYLVGYFMIHHLNTAAAMFPHLQQHSGVCVCVCLVGETEPYLVLFLGPWRAIASANQSSLRHRNKV